MSRIPPDEVIERLKLFCTENDLGMSCMVTEDFSIIICGNRDIGASEMSLIVAHFLLGGVLSGAWAQANEDALKKEKKEKVM